ncbi:MAG: endonuclease/exonuclease/phosphatase family protein [Flavobacteriaceae bacterium]|nr:endonuclease/exonuclease/phosphatase family protein [Flavobacteriaceae bacterium]MDG1344420.1 endonuclease/exonuclease/phosphatase family protein [Flavobacteriaceae bacterium]
MTGLCYLLSNYHLEKLSSFSVLIIFLPIFLCINFLFFIYWIIKLDIRFIFSFLVLLVYVDKPISFFKTDATVDDQRGLQVMSYNVRLFNHYNWIKDSSVRNKIKTFVNDNKPDFIAVQEFHDDYRELMNDFKYSHIDLKEGNVGLAIFGNSKMINKGDVVSSDKRKIAIYVDFVYKKDTLRLYNSHFKSYNINPLSFKPNKETFKNVLNKTKLVYKIQNDECSILIDHMKKSPYSLMLAIDLNNTSDSFVYKKINDLFFDSYVQTGFEFGATYDFSFLPIRIDYIFYSKLIKANTYQIHNVKLSDHKPISVFFNI